MWLGEGFGLGCGFDMPGFRQSHIQCKGWSQDLGFKGAEIEGWGAVEFKFQDSRSTRHNNESMQTGGSTKFFKP